MGVVGLHHPAPYPPTCAPGRCAAAPPCAACRTGRPSGLRIPPPARGWSRGASARCTRWPWRPPGRGGSCMGGADALSNNMRRAEQHGQPLGPVRRGTASRCSGCRTHPCHARHAVPCPLPTCATEDGDLVLHSFTVQSSEPEASRAGSACGQCEQQAWLATGRGRRQQTLGPACWTCGTGCQHAICCSTAPASGAPDLAEVDAPDALGVGLVLVQQRAAGHVPHSHHACASRERGWTG